MRKFHLTAHGTDSELIKSWTAYNDTGGCLPRTQGKNASSVSDSSHTSSIYSNNAGTELGSLLQPFKKALASWRPPSEARAWSQRNGQLHWVEYRTAGPSTHHQSEALIRSLYFAYLDTFLICLQGIWGRTRGDNYRQFLEGSRDSAAAAAAATFQGQVQGHTAPLQLLGIRHFILPVYQKFSGFCENSFIGDKVII